VFSFLLKIQLHLGPKYNKNSSFRKKEIITPIIFSIGKNVIEIQVFSINSDSMMIQKLAIESGGDG